MSITLTRLSVQASFDGITHSPDNPKIVGVMAVAVDTLGIVLQEHDVERTSLEPHKLAADERFASHPKEKKILVWNKGKLEMAGKSMYLYKGKQKKSNISMSGDGTMIHKPYGRTGNSLKRDYIEKPQSYVISSKDDSDYSNSTHPIKVSYKRKPNRYDCKGFRVVIYLKLPHALKEGKNYKIEFKGINTDKAEVSYLHDSQSVRSEVVHVSHIGFRPDDPEKLARISLWTGTGGAFDPTQGKSLKAGLLNNAGKLVWKGETRLIRKASELDQLRKNRNIAKSHVHIVDFSSFKKPGTYRVWVDGIGTSYPFDISEATWLDAFKISMQGLLSHRSGIALPKELMGYERPRNMHPDDGFKVYDLDLSHMHGMCDAIQESFMKMHKAGKPLFKENKKAWGGYMDAGDWDRRSVHLTCTSLLLELYEMNPEFWNKTSLVLPKDETSNRVPDLLDECWYNLSLYHRLQEADGGVRAGIESTAHPRGAEASWMESLAIGTYAPSPRSCMHFAAAAAHFSRLIKPFDSALAGKLARDSARAFDWAIGPKGLAVWKDLEARNSKNATKLRREYQGQKAAAAVQLLRISGDQKKYLGAIEEYISKNSSITPTMVDEFVFYSLAIMPEGSLSSELKKKCTKKIISNADNSLKFQKGNAWGLANTARGLPHMGYCGYLSVPGMVSRSLSRAHYLTGEDKYLAGAISSCAFSAGANPDNKSYTTGLGPNPVQWPLHIDSYVTGQEAPKGLTIFGPGDPESYHSFEGWVYQWVVNKTTTTPPGRQWPFGEALWDMYRSPANNEYTVQQTIAPTAYTWGYLASRLKR
ncbi:MAG: glycoside hydrolase family 9 protein [Planctomycetes bacterium]|nr:glycoside hydrolase family 9 protein [Planctomycetota bacterium]